MVQGRSENTCQYIFNLMQNFPRRWVVFDLRTPEEYSHMRLLRSINVPYSDNYSESPTIDEVRAHARGSRDLFDHRKRFLNIIVYCAEGVAFAREIEHLLTADKCKEVHLLQKNFSDFALNYYFLCTYGINDPYIPKWGYPSEIISLKLYIGDRHHAKDPLIIENLKITHILDATISSEMPFASKGVIYLRLQVKDCNYEDISRYFSIAFDFISTALSKCSNRVLVHCAQGISRSSTLVIMYLMKSRKIGFEEAFEIVKTQRESASPNEGFISQLKSFEKSLMKEYKGT
ncbi:unnamed protein product [Blepharisma stoltei]|uniref:protein-tyrosine-phosphatase n=1 Tax=Blepharisma stoltei TaxID=1481888 RepID=A0AAU9JSA6_9CILI|nr:unnamed protein product [Blepharisma stoltei]